MRINGLVLVAASLLAIGVNAADDKDALKGDKEKLQGVWKPVKAEGEGKEATEDAVKKLPKLGVEGDKVTTPGAGLLEAIYDGPLDLDTTGKVKRITFHDEGPDGKLTFHGIYSLDGDELTICLNQDGTSKEKPSEFVTKKGSPFCVIKFQREKK
ncbi:MAG: TIGR03067 domain-containing protein [Gemmataceae bacterium]